MTKKTQPISEQISERLRSRGKKDTHTINCVNFKHARTTNDCNHRKLFSLNYPHARIRLSN